MAYCLYTLLANRKIMTRNEELIEKYKRWIKKSEKEMKETDDRSRYLFLDGKITAYKMVIIDLLE